MNKFEPIQTAEAPDHIRDYDDRQGGVLNEFSSGQAAQVAFAYEMRKHGYRPGKNGVWLRDGCAAVMMP